MRRIDRGGIDRGGIDRERQGEKVAEEGGS